MSAMKRPEILGKSYFRNFEVWSKKARLIFGINVSFRHDLLRIVKNYYGLGVQETGKLGQLYAQVIELLVKA